MEHFDAVILGTGTAGQTAAFDLVTEGFKVAIVESSSTPGGTCALSGCQAKKWLYEVVEAVARCSHLQGLGINAPPQVSWQDIIAAKNSFTSKVPDQTIKRLTGSGVRYFNDRGSLVDRYTVRIGDHTVVQADYIIIATGSTPSRLTFEGSEQISFSNEFLDLDHLPRRIAFIGGGFISFEFAHFAARLGSSAGHIHILLRGDTPLRSFDSEMVKLLSTASEEAGIRLHRNGAVESVIRRADGYGIILASGETLEVDLVVHGAGRVANIAHLNLGNCGVRTSAGGIQVNRQLQTSIPNIYAVGDCADSPRLARVADQEAHVAAQNIIAGKEAGRRSQIEYGTVPVVLFTYPQLAMVGQTEDQLIASGKRYWRNFSANLSWPTYRRIGMRHAAFKILVDEAGKCLGAHILSDNGTGIINTIKQAMRDDMSASALYQSNIIAPYPSRESDLIYMLEPLLEP